MSFWRIFQSRWRAKQLQSSVAVVSAEWAEERLMEAAKYRRLLEQRLVFRDRRIAELESPLDAQLPGLTGSEIERLAILAEECGEVVQAVGKVLRHGWESQSPYGSKPNRVALEREIGNVRAVVNLMLDAGDVRLGDVQAWQRAKRLSLEKWTHHQACSMSREAQLEMIRAIESERLG